MKTFLHRLYRAIGRVIPRCVTQTQAIAFNMFLAFFPMLLIIVGAVIGSDPFRQAFRSMLSGLRPVLPPGTVSVLNSFVSQHNSHPLRWLLIGISGTLLTGAQMMKLIMEGFRMVHRDHERPTFLSRHVRAMLLLTAMLLPSVLTVNLIVFGKQLRGWMLHASSMPVLIRVVWSIAYASVCLLIAMSVLSMVYLIGRPGTRSWVSVVPGAAIATVLWWVVSVGLGFYLRYLPYSIVYGSLAVTIGLLIWMQLTATILLIGAAYNAELQEPSN